MFLSAVQYAGIDPAILEGVHNALPATDVLIAVAVKLPLFWPENIETWFVQSKSQFRLKGVSVSQTKLTTVSSP